MEYFVKMWKLKGIPFYWIRRKETEMKMLLENDAEKLIDAKICRKYKIKSLKTKGNDVYEGKKKMCTVLALSTCAKTKGVAYYDPDFLWGEPILDEHGHKQYKKDGTLLRKWTGMEYHICVDEIFKEKGEKSSGDIYYQYKITMENIFRSEKEHIKIFLIANMVESCADIMTKAFNFIPTGEFGRYKLKKKRCVVEYLPPSAKYIQRRTGSYSDLITNDDENRQDANYTNKIKHDLSLITKKRLHKPLFSIHFENGEYYTVWDDYVINQNHGENCSFKIAMKPYEDLVFDPVYRDWVYDMFNRRLFKFHDLVTMLTFQAWLKLVRPTA